MSTYYVEPELAESCCLKQTVIRHVFAALPCLYILGDEDLHYPDTNETAHLIKSPIHPNLFRVTH